MISLIIVNMQTMWRGRVVSVVRGIACPIKPQAWQTNRLMLTTYCTHTKPVVAAKDVADTGLSEMLEAEDEGYFKERFIPLTRRSMIRLLMQERSFLTPQELKRYEEFVTALDSAIINKYHSVLRDLKILYDGINPDKETISSQTLPAKERQDNEFWLLQKLSNVMRTANFHELPNRVVERALREHKAAEGIMVSVDPGKYSVLRFWALGRETPLRAVPWRERMLGRVRAALSNMISRSTGKQAGTGTKQGGEVSSKPLQYYKRVVVAQRLKRHDKLLLKMFKEVPVNALEQLLPDGRVRMSALDHGLLLTMLGLSSAGVFAKLVTWLAAVNVQWTLIVSAVTGLTALRGVYAYKSKQNSYVAQLNRMLYFNNIANNRGLLALLVDRAEDEMLKEALLVYTFLLTQKPPSTRLSSPPPPGDDTAVQALPGGLTAGILETRIEDWIKYNTNVDMEFDSVDSVQILDQLGVLSRGGGAGSEGELYVLPLGAACSNLPAAHPSSAAHPATHTDYDLAEGYDTYIDYMPEVVSDRLYGAEQRNVRARWGWGGKSKSYSNVIRVKFMDRLGDMLSSKDKSSAS